MSGYFGPPTKGHVIQRMCNPKIAMVRYTAKSLYYDIAILSGDALLRRHKKSQMADGRHFEDR